ncbi:MAG TPA: L-histidine N(alpha)-methyltransferase [Gammaproteobacteria bacterium]
MSLSARKTANVVAPDRLFEEEQAEIIDGLKADNKSISPKYFYDQRGSELFNDICKLPEYYLTRTEARIMAENYRDIAARIGPRAAVIEFGAGSNAKAKRLLSHLESPVAYVPVEISGEYLSEQAEDLQQDLPGLSIKPVVADFTKPFDLPPHPVTPERNLIFFPGSTIGNFTRDDALNLLRVMLAEAKPGGALLIGVDLIKNPGTIAAAYNDSQGVTAEFNRNALRHINEGLGATFQPELFRHEAVYDKQFDRVEMRLISVKPHTVDIAGEEIDFDGGEHIVTEYSHKYSVDGFAALAESAGWMHETVWRDADNLFSVHFLCAP